MNYIQAYVDEIHAGRIVVSRRVREVYERLADDIQNPKNGIVFDEKKANRPIEFIERFCRHSKGEWAGKPVILELFQRAYLQALFGFIHKDTGLRKYRESFFYVARKAGKTTLMAGLALYMLIADGEAGAEVYSLGTKRDQAKLLFDEAHNMVKQSPDLTKLIHKRKTDLYFPLTFGKMQPLAKNSNSLDGLNSHCCILDEVHAWTDPNLYNVMKTSQSARRQPLLICITTAGHVRESVFDDMYRYATGVADGTITDETFLPIMYELDDQKEWTDPKCWAKANPGLSCGIKKLEDIITKVERAKQSPADLNGFLCKDMNVRVSSANSWLMWDEIENTETFDIEDFRGCYAIGGADLSQCGDLTCATIVMIGKDGRHYVKQQYWLPKDTFDKRLEEEKTPYRPWVDAGLVRLCEGNSIVYSDITAWFLDVVNVWGITPIAVYYDAWGSRYWTQEMESHGFNMVPCRQGEKTLSLPMQQLGQDLKAKKVVYDNSPVLKWCISNTGVVVSRNGGIVPVKAQQPKHRIDGLASLLDAYVGLIDHYTELENLI